MPCLEEGRRSARGSGAEGADGGHAAGGEWQDDQLMGSGSDFQATDLWWTAKEWPDWLPSPKQRAETPSPLREPCSAWDCLPFDLIHRVLLIFKRLLGSRALRPACKALGQVNRHWHASLNREVTTLQLRGGIASKEFHRLLQRFKFLEKIRLQECRDGCLAVVGAYPYSFLRVLDLQGCHEVTDTSLADIRTLGHLKRLDLTNCVRLSDEGLQVLKSLTSLVFLSLRVSWSSKPATPESARLQEFTTQGFAALGRVTSLTELSLKGRKEVDDAMLAELTGLVSLTSLKLSTTNITDTGLGTLGQLRSLVSLRVACTNVTDDGFQHLTVLTGLHCLRMSNCLRMTDEGVDAIAKIRPLAKLLIGHAPMVTDSGLHSLSRLVNLRALVFGYCGSVTAQGMRSLEKLPCLSRVGFKRCSRVARKELITLRTEIPSFLKLKLFCH
eukprot:evm.model.scf_29.10 EVM.evm.TU.scf_29.10   scf_29:177273-180998(+)